MGDRERQISAFIRKLALSKGHRGTGGDTRLRSNCGQKVRGLTRASYGNVPLLLLALDSSAIYSH